MNWQNTLPSVLNVNKLRLNTSIQPDYYNHYYITSWKWEITSLDFITGLPRNQNLNDSIMVVVDKISKEAHFIPVKTTYKTANISDIFMKQISCLHGIPKVIISDRDPKFIGNF